MEQSSIKGTNPGPVGKRGGYRKGAGRKSLAQKALRQLATVEGKSTTELLAEVDAGYTRALRVITTILPDILANMADRALRGDIRLQMYLTSLYFKYVSSPPHITPARTPVINLYQSLKQVVEQAGRDGIIEGRPSAQVEVSGHTVIGDPTEPDAVGDFSGFLSH